MKKKIIITITILLILIIIFLISYNIYQYYRIKNAKIIVKLKENRLVEVFDNVKISDFIDEINGKIIKDSKIDTTKVGEQEITFDYTNDENIKVSYKFLIKVSDTTPPIIGVPQTYSVTVGEEVDLSKKFFCGDKYDNKPQCIVEGEYDLNEAGSYKLNYVATDNSGNTTNQYFTLVVKEKTKSSKSSSNNNYNDYNEIISKYKTDNNKIGIDISHWQGDIDFEKTKESGVEFVMIRVGTENAEGEYYLDKKFEENIKGFNKVGIPVGIYYYSYATSPKKAKKEAEWVIKQIKDYKIDLPVVFDWEDWSDYQSYNLSFYNLSQTADSFLKTIKKAGYEPMLYSSKYYLENIWFKTKYKVWLAHYTDRTTYEGDYYIWQICSNGKVDGIDDNLVDIDILYEKR